MSKTLVIYAHPNPSSFNHAIADTATAALTAQGHEVRVRDLYAMNFNPVLTSADMAALADGKTPDDIRAEQEHLLWADYLVFTYPIWWFGRPAILQGYIDRVLAHGFAYQIEANGSKGLLKHKGALVFQTTGVSETNYAADGLDHAIHKPMIEGTLGYCGVQNARIQTFYAVTKVDDTARHDMLGIVKKLVGEFA